MGRILLKVDVIKFLFTSSSSANNSVISDEIDVMLKKEVVPEQSDSQESRDSKSEAESNVPDVTLPDTKRYDRRGKPKFEGTTSDSSLTDIENSPSRKSETTSDKDDKGKSPLDASATEAKSNSDIFSDSIIDQSV